MDKDAIGCKTCFLPSDFPGITFDREGICNDCRAANSRRSGGNVDGGLGLEALRALGGQLREDSRRRNSGYDCIIGASGGLDSTYVIYLARQVMDVHPLVVKYSNGFGHPLAEQNLRSACDRLGVDLVVVPPIPLERQYLYHAIKALRHLGIFFSSCFSCHFTIAAVVYKYAAKHNIEFMLTSTNPFESHLSMTSHGFMLRQLSSAFWQARLRNKVAFALGELRAQVTLLRLKHSFDGLSTRWLKNAIRLHPVAPASIQKVNLSQYVPWDLKAIEALLRTKLGWQSPRNTEGPYMRFDCHVLNLVDYSFLKTAGISEHGLLTNFMVQNGIVDKEAAREDFKFFSDASRYVTEANEVLEQLGIERLEKPPAIEKV